jgi:hypothetical protein
MPITLTLQQILIPVVLLGWMVLRPLPGRRLFLFQATGVGVSLLAIGQVGLWIMPPWWAPWLFGATWGGAVVWRLHRMRSSAFFAPRARWETRASVAFVLLLALAGIMGAGAALSARGAPTAEVIDIPNPLGPGSYLVAHGGRRTIVNGHMKTLDPGVERFRGWRGQSYAVDLVGIDRQGLRADGLRPEDPTRYLIFGVPVHAPCAGEVTGAENGLPDMPVPVMDSEHLLGNHVLLACDGIVLALAHLREGSVVVNVGEQVALGQRLGEVGNSGNSSEPHLHLHAQRPGLPNAPISGEPIGLRVDGRWLVRNDRIDGTAW